MSGIDLSIDRLRLHLWGAEGQQKGQQKRIASIVERASQLFAERVGTAQTRPCSRRQIDLRKLSDEQAASAIADEWLLAAWEKF